MSESLGDRLAAARKRLGMTQPAFSQASGLPLGTVKQYEGSHRQPGADALELITRAGIDLHWLLTGEGEMLHADRPASGLDQDVLSGVLEAIEQRLQGRTLPPAKKAALIALVYDSVASGVACEPATVERYIRLAS